jgi:hypothetical protein
MVKHIYMQPSNTDFDRLVEYEAIKNIDEINKEKWTYKDLKLSVLRNYVDPHTNETTHFIYKDDKGYYFSKEGLGKFYKPKPILKEWEEFNKEIKTFYTLYHSLLVETIDEILLLFEGLNTKEEVIAYIQKLDVPKRTPKENIAPIEIAEDNPLVDE